MKGEVQNGRKKTDHPLGSAAVSPKLSARTLSKRGGVRKGFGPTVEVSLFVNDLDGKRTLQARNR
jgi:hypothetical protein